MLWVILGVLYRRSIVGHSALIQQSSLADRFIYPNGSGFLIKLIHFVEDVDAVRRRKISHFASLVLQVFPV